eukprot:scaffold450_cov175-Amphora_coffeaeformis.AAC.3
MGTAPRSLYVPATGIKCMPKFRCPWARSRNVERVANGSGPRSNESRSTVVMVHRPHRCHTTNCAVDPI